MPESSPPAVLFDLDGTVWDSMPGIVASLRHALDVVDTPVPDGDLVRFIGPPLIVMLADVGVREDLIDEARIAYRERYHRVGVYEAELYPGMVELLDELRRAGVALATATSKGVDATHMMLDHFDLTDRFDVVAAASMDATSHHKVDVIGDALDRLGPHDNAVMVGDRSYDIEGGRHHGLTTVAVTWGYGSPEERDATRPDAVATDVADLRSYLIARVA